MLPVTRGSRAAARVALALLLAPGAVHAQAPPAADTQEKPGVNRDAKISVDFVERVKEYVELHKKLEPKLPSRPDEATPEQINQHQRELARLIEQARPQAKPGELFTKETRAYFRRLLAGAFSGAEGRKMKASINDENPGPIRLRVNGRYPDTVPLSTMPPQVLASLPRLPEELEYRFIGERLILLDIHAHMVVDYMDDALPK